MGTPDVGLGTSKLHRLARLDRPMSSSQLLPRCNLVPPGSRPVQLRVHPLVPGVTFSGGGGTDPRRSQQQVRPGKGPISGLIPPERHELG